MKTKCPMCGKMELEVRRGELRIPTPDNIPGDDIIIKNCEWEECSSCGEQILSDAITQIIDKERYNRLGLLTPAELKDFRTQLGYTQKQIASLLDVGEKTYTRWENGYSIQSKSSDDYIRLVKDNFAAFMKLKTQQGTDRKQQAKDYLFELSKRNHSEQAIAAHDGDEIPKKLVEKLKELIKEHKG